MDCLCGKPLGTNRKCSFCRGFRVIMHIKEKTYDTEDRRPYRGEDDLE